MTAYERPREMLWIEVPATSTAEDLARVVDAYPPGSEGRSYLVHMDLLAGRVAFGDALTERGYQVTVSEEMLRRYTFGTQPEHFAVFWLGDPDTPGETANPVVSLLPAEHGLAPDRLQTAPPYTEVSLAAYHQWQHQGEPS
jgi:hypothetical protein